MTNAGYGWTVGPVNSNPSLSYLQSFDAVFLAGNPVNNDTLIDYVNGGGNVFLAGGTGQGNANGVWNPFLNAFGLAFGPDYNDIVGNMVINSIHPIFANVSSLYQGSGNDTLDITPSDANSRVLVTFNGHGLYAVYDSGPEPISIDIKPGKDHKSINFHRDGEITVAILATSEFYASDIVDKDSLTFGLTGDEDSLAFCYHRPEDINGDGLEDLICHFYTEDTGFTCGDTEGILKGTTKNGRRIQGSDSVPIEPCEK